MNLNVNSLDGSKLSLNNICQILEQKHPYYQYLINSGKNVSSFDVKNISSGFGHGSIVYKLTLHFKTTSIDTPSSSSAITIAIKIPTCEIFYQQMLKVNPELPENFKEIISQKFAQFHKTECFFYSKIAPFLKNVKIPKIYATKDWILEGGENEEMGYILMEDLSDVGYVLSKYDSVSEGKIKAAVKEIAHIQAEWIKASLNIDWKEIESENVEQIWAENVNNFSAFVPAFIDLVDDNDREKTKTLLNKIMVLAGNKDYHIWAFQNGFKELGLPTVLVHGDFWNSNIFFKNNGNQENEEILTIIDWQKVYEGSPGADLARYLILVESDIRRKIESTIFSFFIECLNSKLPNIASTSFNESNLRKAYIYSFISEFIKLLMITVRNVRFLQHLIDNNENVITNGGMKNKFISLTIHAMEDVAKFIDEELADVVVARFQKP